MSWVDVEQDRWGLKIRNGPMQMGNRRGRGIEVQRPGNTNEKRRDGMMRRKLKMAIIGED